MHYPVHYTVILVYTRNNINYAWLNIFSLIAQMNILNKCHDRVWLEIRHKVYKIILRHRKYDDMC